MNNTADPSVSDPTLADLTLADAIRLVTSATNRTDLLGTTDAAHRYRQLIRVLHPDRVTTSDPTRRDAAAEAFHRLQLLWRNRDGDYRFGERLYTGDLTDLYDVGDGRILKLPRNPANNDLMDREARALRRLAAGDARYLPYAPRLIESLRHRDPDSGKERQATVTSTVTGLRSLSEVRAAFPDGVDPRDVAWMWRRLLVALGFAHRAGVVHGAVLPPHVLIHPAEHGLVLIDWCYSTVGPDERVPALVPEFASWYPVEVTGRQSPGPGTDIAMATRCMTYLMGERAPDRLRNFAAGCALPALRQRPDDAWRLLAELDDLLERLYGPRRFRPFRL